jgi:hypothetical protein
MFGVLVVVFCPDGVAALDFSLGERQIPLIVSLRVVKALLFGGAAFDDHRFERPANRATGLGWRVFMFVFRSFCMRAAPRARVGGLGPQSAPRRDGRPPFWERPGRAPPDQEVTRRGCAN